MNLCLLLLRRRGREEDTIAYASFPDILIEGYSSM
jgi:hypothetical protein